MNATGLLFCWLAAGLVGCAALDPPPAMQPALPTAWSNQTDPADKRPPVDLTRWWTEFGDAVLDRLVNEAAVENLSLQQAASRVAAARASRDATVAGLLPTIAGTGVIAGERVVGAGTSNQIALPIGPVSTTAIGQPVTLGSRSVAYYEPGLDAAWEVPLFGQGAATQKAADAAFGEAASDYAAAQVRLVAEVARTYIILRADQQRQDLLTASLAAERRLADLVETRSGAGLASDFDLARARNAADQVATKLAPLEGEIRESLQKLATLHGQAVADATLSAPAPQPKAPTASLAEVPADLLRLRPDIVHAEHTVEERAGELGIAVADLYPKLTLLGSISLAGSFSGSPLPGPVGLFGGGPAITIPLIDWGARLARAKARNAQLAASVLDYRQTVLVGIEEVETALAHVAAARGQAKAARQAVASAEQALGYADLLYGRGLTPLSDRLDAERMVLDARLDLVASTQSEAISAIALYKAIGGRIPDETGR
jgi:NodT family efflux transporter outer membrane factor (OMF) lipoprotein